MENELMNSARSLRSLFAEMYEKTLSGNLDDAKKTELRILIVTEVFISQVENYIVSPDKVIV